MVSIVNVSKVIKNISSQNVILFLWTCYCHKGHNHDLRVYYWRINKNV